MIPIAWDPDAWAEFANALARSPDPGRFRQDVDAVLGDLASGLLAGSPVPGTSCREFPMTRLPYRIVYLDDPAILRLVAFAHRGRRPGYWKSRVP